MDRRDRHGRGIRGPLAPPTVPLSLTRREEFVDLVAAAAEDIAERLDEIAADDRIAAFESLAFAVTDIPDADVLDLVTGAGGQGSEDSYDEEDVGGIPLARVLDAEADRPATVVVHRRPIEQRTDPGPDRAALVELVVRELVADLIGMDPDDLV